MNFELGLLLLLVLSTNEDISLEEVEVICKPCLFILVCFDLPLLLFKVDPEPIILDIHFVHRDDARPLELFVLIYNTGLRLLNRPLAFVANHANG